MTRLLHFGGPLLATLLGLGCSAKPTQDERGCPDATPLLELPSSEDGAACFRYGWTRQLPGSGTFATVAFDGHIAALSLVDGVHVVSVLTREGDLLGSFQVEPYGDFLRVSQGGEIVVASRSGSLARFDAQGNLLGSLDLNHPIEDLALTPSGTLLVSWSDAGQDSEPASAVVAAYGRNGAPRWSIRLGHDAAPSLAVSPDGFVVATGRAACTGARAGACARAEPGDLVGFSRVLDPDARQLTEDAAWVDRAHPVGPLFVRSGFMGSGTVLRQLTTWSGFSDGRPVSPSDASGDVEGRLSAPDSLVAKDVAGTACWTRTFRPLDETGYAHLIAFHGSGAGAVLDLNGDVYKQHHILRLSIAGTVRWRYDRANDGMMNEVALAGLDERGMVVLSGRFDGTQDFDPGSAVDLHTSSIESRRYVSALFDCEDSSP